MNLFLFNEAANFLKHLFFSQKARSDSLYNNQLLFRMFDYIYSEMVILPCP
jgi:hypothetical protein